ncbi:Pesticidal crystal protein Cry22Aa Ig-like domain-containing protein [Flavobacterium longum]|uniref:immunoglobulin-like domain-containing protein n=1 Tax=Flavobacterium longum TaxID=1299340 RepID=UPI0039ED62EF
MKKIILFLSVAALMVSCQEQDSANVSRVTNYPNFELLGDDVIIVPKGSAFVDPGVIVTEGGVEIAYETTVSGEFRGGTSIDTNVEDIYAVTYSATNQDGFSGQASRTVIVVENGDLSTSIAGLYRGNVVRNGVVSAQYQNLEYVLIWNEGGNNYHMSDGIGGYYAIGRSYGNAYAAPMDIVANDIPTNSFTIPNYTVGTFGGVVDNTEFTVNAEGGTINFVSAWDAGFTFNVTLEKVEF